MAMLILAACSPTAQTTGDATPPEPVAETKSEALRVVAWNIEWFPGRSPRANQTEEREHRAAIEAFLPTLNADILLLQEIRDREAAEFLAKAAGLELHVASNLTRPDTDISQQLVIASRLPAIAGFAEVFTDIYEEPDTVPYRGFAFAALENPKGGTLLVYSVHLKSNRGDASYNIPTREESARQVLKHVNEMKEQFKDRGPLAVIVGGDFNVLLNQEAMAHEKTLEIFKEAGFHWGWEGVPFEQRATWPGRGPYGAASFDHMFTWGLPEYTLRMKTLPSNRLSDHLPIILDME